MAKPGSVPSVDRHARPSGPAYEGSNIINGCHPQQPPSPLPTSTVVFRVDCLSSILQEGTFPERKALIRNFVEGIEVVGDEATLTYTVPMPSDGVTSESASVLDFVKSGPPERA